MYCGERACSCGGSWRGETMKMGVLAVAVLVTSGSFAEAQELQKGNLVGTHVMTIKMQTGGKPEQLKAFHGDRRSPAAEKIWPGWRYSPVRRIRGEKADGFGLLIVIPSEAERDKYYNA